MDEYKKSKGMTTAELALRLGTTLGTLNAYLYRATIKPSLEFLQGAASLAGCSVSEFIDDPGSKPAGIDLSGYSDIDRYRFEQMIRILSNKAFSDADKDLMLEDLRNRAKAIERNTEPMPRFLR